MADNELQVTLTLRNQISDELKKVLGQLDELEASLRDATNGTSDASTRDIQRLGLEVKDTQTKAEMMGAAVNKLDGRLDELGHSADTAGRKTDELGRSMGQTQSKSKAFTAGWGKMVGVVAAATAAVQAASGAFRFLSQSVDEARQARKAMAQTAAVMRSMGRTEAPARIDKMIDQLEAASGIDGDNLREMTNVMFTFGKVTGKTFERANALALDLSVAYGKDLASSAVMVGKALNDPAKGLTALSRVGVQFTKAQQDQVKAMMANNDMAGAQKIILAELSRQVKGSAKAQADEIDKSMVAYGNLKEEIGNVLLAFGDALASATGVSVSESLNKVTKWIKQHKNAIVSVLLEITAAGAKFASVWIKQQSIVVKGLSIFVTMWAKALAAVALIIPQFRGAADKAAELATGMGDLAAEMGDQSKAADNLANKLHRQAQKSRDAQKAADDLRNALSNLTNKKYRLVVRTVAQGFTGLGVGATVGDTTAPWGGPKLGAAGLAAAHAHYSAGVNAMHVTSGIRHHGLGSSQSDHRHGRAMDVRGPYLGAYAARVRASGGYAAMHGVGPGRHLHVAPRGAPDAGGQTTNVYDIDIHAGGTDLRPFDLRNAVDAGIRQAERRRRERGGP